MVEDTRGRRAARGPGAGGPDGVPADGPADGVAGDGRVDAALMRATEQVLRLEADLAAAREQLAGLETALQSNRRIGMALGILMALRKVDEAAAFELLRTVSSRRNRKLRLVAEDVIRTGTVEWEPPPEVGRS
ncbi:ANTAR domain-containing protein [Geodermatophilus dictyosporus]|uniref:ANTAR domain-containing protein n=1 Tax=Geodermatophilus dictyosporus TaxID=1523247 RepID=A0A1I5RRK0_9ACTN|nr:ANTAR domain-containing protein [Geodermatophilus dictyosporus]SFP60881.1 ANTAR domain-containing protein [Geodermatophilus dictyosporus]